MPCLIGIDQLFQRNDPNGSHDSSMRKEPWMRTAIILSMTLAACCMNSTAAGQRYYSNTKIQPKPVPPEQQLDLPPAKIRLTAPKSSRVAIVREQPRTQPAPVATPAPAPVPRATTATTAVQPAPVRQEAAAVEQPPAVDAAVAQSPETKVAQPQTQPVRRTYQPQQQRYQPQQQRQGFFGQIMQMERRKNAWLRRTFFN